MLTRKEVILAKIESTYNTDAAPIGTDAVMVENLTPLSYESLRMVERPVVKSTLGPLQQIYGGSLGGISFDCEIKGPGASYSASVLPEIDTVLRICGLSSTLVAGTSVTYSPVSTAFESATIYYYQDGTLQKLTGARATASFSLATGDKGKVSFTITGHQSAVTDAATVVPTYDSSVPPIVKGAAFAVGGYSAVVSTLSADLSNQISAVPDMNSAEGFGEVRITGRDVNGSIDPEAVLVATNDFDAQFKAGTSMALTTGVIGGTQFNRYAFSMPAISYRGKSSGDREGVRTLDLPFGAAESTTDDEISIAFT